MQLIRKFKIGLLVFTCCFLGVNVLFSQHQVKVKIGKQVYTVSGDTTKYNFKSTIAKLEKRFGEAADYKLKAITNGEITKPNVAYYEAACFYSMDNALEKAAKYLKISIDKGWNDMAHLEYNKDLNNLRKTTHWNSIIPSINKYYTYNNREVASMYADDQKARLSGKRNTNLVKEDSLRREKIKALLKKRKVRSADDYYKAAMIMHHGTSLKDYKLAHRLAKKAFKKKNPHIMAPWLVAATKDRYLLKKGKKQWYATQGLTFKNGRMALDPQKIDTTAVKNNKRIALNAPSIEKIRSYLKAFKTKK